MPALYVVATPIGNLEDITLRAIRVLKEVKLIAAEDTRQTRILLNKYDIRTPLTSYHEHNKLTRLDYILTRLQNDDVALVSDAGMPGISDPGYELIQAVNQANIRLIPVPGPSVPVTALVVSGLPTDSFYYLGFLPPRASARRRFLVAVSQIKQTIILFESPHRLPESLQDLLDILGDRKIAVCREMTKIYEEVFRGNITEAIKHFQEPRGEFTLVIEGAKEVIAKFSPEDIIKRLKTLHQSGLTSREAMAVMAEETGIPHKEIYRTWINTNKGA
jgi:16S rRNA (cytidine1402-2'-O)-methyltransferase